MKDRQIEHRGIVKEVMPQCVKVTIVQEVACATCAAASLCHSSEKNQRTIDIPTSDAGRYAVGQEVAIVGWLGLGLRATVWAYAMPLVVLMAVLSLVYVWTGSEGWGALSALLALILYYIVLYAFRGRLQRKFTFQIKEL